MKKISFVMTVGLRLVMLGIRGSYASAGGISLSQLPGTFQEKRIFEHLLISDLGF
jgi:hypothetical protein